jgi:cytochrome b pre-mRNA-processing protein 3
MFKILFRSTANRALIEKIHGGIVAAARQEAFYAGYGVPDTVEGRFEMVTLHAMLALRALRHAPAPGPAMASALSDTVFRHFDETLREMGVGDASIAKRMMQLAGAFVGRCSAYEAALAAGELTPLEAALHRNIFAPQSGDSVRLARYSKACVLRLEQFPLEKFAQADKLFYAAAEIE